MVVKQGYKQTELGFIPEDWILESMENIADIIMGQSPLGDSYNSRNGMPLLNGPTEFGTIHPQPIQFTTKPTTVSKINDILLCVRGSTTGKLNLSNQEYCIGRGLASIRGKINKTDTKWLFYHFKKLQNYILHVSTGAGSTFPNINKDTINKILLPCPSFKEQQKISETLSHCDELIFKTMNLIEKKKNIKQGTMQKLLTGKLQVHNSKPMWTSSTLGEIIKISKGQQLNKSQLTLQGDYPVWNGGIEPSGFTHMFNELENTVTISEGGNSCGFVNYSSQKFWCGGHCYALKNPKIKLNKTFLYYVLKLQEKSIMRLRVGSGLPNIQKKRIMEFPIILPDLSEQNIIANIISNMDSEIKSLKMKKDKYIMIKQGMMQKLLIGEIRLK